VKTQWPDPKKHRALNQNCRFLRSKGVVVLFLKKGGNAMCDRCVELDGKIEHYQCLASNITDQATLDGIKKLVERLEAQKAGLHPERTK
jgi:hypothetical protein